MRQTAFGERKLTEKPKSLKNLQTIKANYVPNYDSIKMKQITTIDSFLKSPEILRVETLSDSDESDHEQFVLSSTNFMKTGTALSRNNERILTEAKKATALQTEVKAEVTKVKRTKTANLF
jgi:hypothetical protein